MLGCIFSDVIYILYLYFINIINLLLIKLKPKHASGVVAMVILPYMVVSGFFSNRANLSPIISWIEYTSPFKYGFDS